MSVLKYLNCREVGKTFNWIYFEEIYPGSDIKDWRRGHKIIKIGDSNKTCNLCFNPHQKIIIRIPEMVDLYGFSDHFFYEYACMYCDSHFYIT